MYNPYQQQQQQQQQSAGFIPQQTGYVGGFNQQQPGQQYGQPQPQQAFQAPGLQNQATGFYQPQLQQQNYYQPQGFQLQPTGFGNAPLQSQQTGYIQTQPTGFQGAPIVVENSDLKIPSIRLSFITIDDQKKFEHLFRTAVPKGELTITGDSASNILLRSGLSPVTLAEIWSLSDTNKSGSLLFPEFALSLHLCSMAKKGESLPAFLPEKWQNEVKSFVDAINFSVPEDPSNILANTPFASFGSKPAKDDWLAPQGSGYIPPAPQQTFQPQQTGFGGLIAQRTGPGFGNQLESSIPDPLSSQRTGGGSLIPLQPQQTAGLIPAQKTGPLQQQTTGYQNQALQAQTTGYQPLQAQNTGYQQGQSTGYQQPQTTGFQQPLTSQRTGPLQAQGTGYQSSGFQPQTTGFQPQATGFQPQATGFQPQATGFQPLQSQPTGKPGQWGFVSMPTGGIPGLNAMEQHFLPNSDSSSNTLQNSMGGSLKSNVGWAITKQEKQIYDGVFAAWDTQRRGYVDGTVALDVFSKSGLGRPDLESIWNLADTSDRGKLNKDEFAVAMHLVYRRLNGLDIPLRLPPELIPPSNKHLQDSMDTLKNSLKRGTVSKPAKNVQNTKSDGTRFKNDDNNFGYVSRNRRKSTAAHDGSDSQSADADLSIDDLKKLIREKKILIDALDAEDQDRTIAAKKLEAANSYEIENLKNRIRDVQAKLIKSSSESMSLTEKKELLNRLNHLTRDKVPKLISSIHSVNQEIANRKIELIKQKLAKEYPNWNPDSSVSEIVGTGPNGQVTDLDRRKHESKLKLKQRMAALTGRSNNSGSNADLDLKLKEETEKAISERDSQSSMVSDIESSIKELEESCATNLQVTNKEEVGASKWKNGQDVSAEVGQFIKELNAFAQESRANTVQTTESQKTAPKAAPTQSKPAVVAEPREKYSNPEDRAAYIKEQAQKRMTERLAKLGITRRGYGNSQESARSTTRIEPVVAEETKPVEPAKALDEVPAKIPEPTKEPEAPKKTLAPEPEAPKKSLATPAEPDDSSDDDDPEYAALLKQKKELEAREQERKLKKQQQRQAKMAKLRKEMEAMEKNEDADSEEDEPVTSVPTYGPNGTGKSETKPEYKSEPAQKEEPVSDPASKEVSKEVSKEELQNSTGPAHSASNPFSKPQLTSNNSYKNSNPFFKPQTQTSTVDAKKAASQRESQRGIGSDDWSDAEDNSSDDDGPNRAGAAQLASLLFGGMLSSTSTPTIEKKESALIPKVDAPVKAPEAVEPSVKEPEVVAAAPVVSPAVVTAPAEATTAVTVPVVSDAQDDNDDVLLLPSSVPPSPTLDSESAYEDTESAFGTPAPEIPPFSSLPPLSNGIPGPPPLPNGDYPPPPPPPSSIPPFPTGGIPPPTGGSAPTPPPPPTPTPPPKKKKKKKTRN